MSSWSSEKEAILNMIEKFGDGVYACVMDNYDYVNAMENLVPSVSKQILEKGGFIVFRPDSGDPVEAVMIGLRYHNFFNIQCSGKGFWI
jgi:nicotinic acid phosphoribosyltransferase